MVGKQTPAQGQTALAGRGGSSRRAPLRGEARARHEALAARWLWHERLSLRHCCGILLIVGGVAVMGGYT